LGVSVDEPGPERAAIARQDLRKLQAALERLPSRWREVVVMRKVQGLSLAEIVTRLGIAERTVSQHLTSGITALANLFHDDPSDQGDQS
jgi:RNA polymerase sigma-70 factor (ECF subfamily)